MPGHADVHDHDVGLAPERQLDGALAVGGLADDADVRRAREREPEPLAHDLVVVDDQGRDLVRHVTGDCMSGAGRPPRMPQSVERELLGRRRRREADACGGRGCRAARASSRTAVRASVGVGVRGGRRGRRRAARTRAAARASRGRGSRGSARACPGWRWSTFAQMPQAPASRAARTTSASCSGRSEMPGRIGAIPTEARMPASTSRSSARSRWRGRRRPGLGRAARPPRRASAPRT